MGRPRRAKQVERDHVGGSPADSRAWRRGIGAVGIATAVIGAVGTSLGVLTQVGVIGGASGDSRIVSTPSGKKRLEEDSRALT
jgi:hypothetical protein